MVFARYVMFSEVYWHHAVRAATAMLQRAFYLLARLARSRCLFRMAEVPRSRELPACRARHAGGIARRAVRADAAALQTPRAVQLLREDRNLYERLARRPYPWLAGRAPASWHLLSVRRGRIVAPHEILFDAPPMQREVEFNIDVLSPKSDGIARSARFRPSCRPSPAVRRLRQARADFRPARSHPADSGSGGSAGAGRGGHRDDGVICSAVRHAACAVGRPQ